jgi:hypothetical protein
MASLGGAISESIIGHYGTDELLTRLADPFWFQAFGSVLGMDWHSSGITTSVIGALKRAMNPKAAELGVYVCGGRGRHSRQTPDELVTVGERTGLDVARDGQWVVIQQGMNDQTGMARRYHWHSTAFKSFVESPANLPVNARRPSPKSRLGPKQRRALPQLFRPHRTSDEWILNEGDMRQEAKLLAE